MDSDIAYLIGKIMGDGHLEKTLGSCYFISSNLSDLLLIKSFIITVFNIEEAHIFLIPPHESSSSYKLRINSTAFCRMLYNYGAPKGRKVKVEYFVPEWIIKNDSSSKAFLQALLEDELRTIKIREASHANEPMLKLSKMPNLITSHEVFMRQIKDLLNSFGVSSSNIRTIKGKKDAKTLDTYFIINGNKKNIIKFKENIGFKFNQEKINSLDHCYNILIKTLNNRKPIYDKNEIMKLRKEGFSIRVIAKKLNIGVHPVRNVISKNL
ncbi:MAG: LAGLIDADG family homing endonuclease [Nanoarchaeota archaeon]